jgi:hypothetical protein
MLQMYRKEWEHLLINNIDKYIPRS